MISNLKELKARLTLPDDWDLLLVGDGSGMSWTSPGGWCGAMLERSRESGAVKYYPLFVGGVNRGSINWMEAMPYWVMVRHHYHKGGGRQLTDIETHIISDSKWVVEAMQGRYLLKNHQDMRALFKFYRNKGYRFHWHHLKREELSLNSLADKLAAVGREYMSFSEAPRPETVFRAEYMCEECRADDDEAAPRQAEPPHRAGRGVLQQRSDGIPVQERNEPAPGG